MKNKDGGGGGLNGEGAVINFPPLKGGGGGAYLRGECLIEDSW